MRSTVTDASRSGAAGVGTRPSSSIFDFASPTPPLRMHSAIASVATGREARGGRRLGEGALAMSVAPESGRNRIMIYGPKPDGTYEIEFQTADGETLAISVPAGETRVLKHFQARMPRPDSKGTRNVLIR